MNKYNDDLKQTIINRYSNGESLNKLSLEYDINWSTIKQWLIKNNIPSNGTGRFEQQYKIYADYAEIYIKDKDSYQIALIDVDDVEKCKNFGIWSLTKSGYAINCKSGTYLHRFIMNNPASEVDHKNHNILDCRKSNLRIATSSQQKMNTRLRKDNTSGHKGVYFDKSRNKWVAGIKSGDTRISKRFDTFEEAVSFYEAQQAILHKEFLCNDGVL